MIDCKDLDQFDQFVAQKDRLLILDFYRPDCGPCKMLSPVLENICMVRPDIQGLKLNLYQFSDLAYQFHVEVVPTVYFVYNQAVVGKFVGYNSEDNILDYIQEIQQTLK